MRALVTGSSGFIGAALVDRLLVLGWTVLGLDSHTDYYSVNLKMKRLNRLLPNPNFEFKQLDITNLEEFQDVLKEFQPDSVFHLAAQAGVRLPLNQTSRYVSSNLIGFSNVLQACIENNIPNLLFASSSSVYGDESEIPYSERERNLKPNSFYGATKLSNEIIASAVARSSSTRMRGMRFFTVYGPYGRPDMAYFRAISSLIADTEFHLFGNGNVERDFTYIDDCVEMIVLLDKELSNHDQGFFDLVNIGGGNPVSINELLLTTEALLNKTIMSHTEPADPKDVAKTMADPTYLLKLIGAKPETQILEGLRRTIEWSTTSAKLSELTEWVNSST